MGWTRCHSDDWYQCFVLPSFYCSTVVRGRQVGSSSDFAFRRCGHDHLAVANLLLHLYRCPLYAPARGNIRHYLQRSIRRLLGTYTVALSTGDPTSKHQSQRGQFKHSVQLGLQLACGRAYPRVAGSYQVAVVSRSRIFLRRQLRPR